MNFPGFLFGLIIAAAGGTGLVLWMRLQGIIKPHAAVADLGFATGPSPIVPGSPVEEEEFAYEGSIPLGASIGHRMASLAGIIIFIAIVGAGLAFAIFVAGNLAIRGIENFIQTSPSP